MGYRRLCIPEIFFILWIDATFIKLHTTPSADAKGFTHYGVGEHSPLIVAHWLCKKKKNNNSCNKRSLRPWSQWECWIFSGIPLITGRKKERRYLLWDFDLIFGDHNKRMNSSDNSVPVLYINQHQPPSLKHHYTVRICPWWEVVILVFMSADKNGSWGERMYCWADLLSRETVFIIDPTLVIQTIPASCLIFQSVHFSIPICETANF